MILEEEVRKHTENNIQSIKLTPNPPRGGNHMIQVVHYINQFFAQIGGEEKADIKPEVREGFVGPGIGLNAII